MTKRIYVGNVPYTATEDELRGLFGAHGEVESVKIVMDRETGQPRGFAFVEMEDRGGSAAIAALDQAEMGGRKLRVDEAKPREGGEAGGFRGGRR